MKLFTPAWKKDDAGKRAKAFDKMKEDRLLAIVLDPDTPSHILGEITSSVYPRSSTQYLPHYRRFVAEKAGVHCVNCPGSENGLAGTESSCREGGG